MRIRYILLALFVLVALAPVALFGLWTAQSILHNEYRSVEDKHLVLAHNLGDSLERYRSAVISVFELVAERTAAGAASADAGALLGQAGFRSLCIADPASGGVLASAPGTSRSCPQFYTEGLFDALREKASRGGTRFTPVMSGDLRGDTVIHVVRRLDDKLAVGTLSTGYFARLIQGVSFGEKGRAAIVDSEGTVLAHPNAGWVRNRHNLADQPVVQRLIERESGIATYQTAAGEKIAGFVSVPGPGWGVIVSQPVAELRAQAASVQGTGIAILGVSLAVAAALALWISMRVARPLERISAAIARSGDGSDLKQVPVEPGAPIPREVAALQDNYNAMVRALHQSQARIRRLAFTDSITALPNREAFQTLVARQLDWLSAHDGTGALIALDIDDFREIYDAVGHDRSNQVLRALADRLAFAVHRATGTKPINRNPEDAIPVDKLARVPVIGSNGGNSFRVFVPIVGDNQQLDKVLEFIRTEVGRPLPDFGTANLAGIANEASLGAACFPKHGTDYDNLAKLADLALYHAKRSGKNRAEVYRPEIGDMTSAEMRADMTRGLAAGEFILHFQPKVNSTTGAVDAVEALIRWEHPQRGLMNPNAFIPVIEHTDVVIEIGEWALGEAARQIKRWDALGIDLGVAVNIAPRHFGMRGFAQRALEVVLGEGVDPSRIEIEITEEAVLASMDHARQIIDKLRAAGFKVSLDDFGRGYSNLARLAGLDVNTIKIDGPLTAGVTEDERACVIVAATIDMAQGLGCTTVAEGVETLEQATMLRSFGCEILQGFYFASPMEGKVLAAWLKDRQLNTVRYLRQQVTDAHGPRLRA